MQAETEYFCSARPGPQANDFKVCNEAFHPCDTIFTARQLSCSKIIFLHLSVILSAGGLCMMSLPVWLEGGLCPWSHIPSREVSMKESLCEGGLCEWGLCERGFFERGFL